MTSLIEPIMNQHHDCYQIFLNIKTGKYIVEGEILSYESFALLKEFKEHIEEGSESWEAGFKRRVVKTTKPEHKEDGYKWRIKGKDRPEISIKLYKTKPDFAEFKKQMKRSLTCYLSFY